MKTAINYFLNNRIDIFLVWVLLLLVGVYFNTFSIAIVISVIYFGYAGLRFPDINGKSEGIFTFSLVLGGLIVAITSFLIFVKAERVTIVDQTEIYKNIKYIPGNKVIINYQEDDMKIVTLPELDWYRYKDTNCTLQKRTKVNTYWTNDEETIVETICLKETQKD